MAAYRENMLSKKKKKLEEMDVEEFMTSGFDTNLEESSYSSEDMPKHKAKQKQTSESFHKDKKLKRKTNPVKPDSDSMKSKKKNNEETIKKSSRTKHKVSMSNLKDEDPEFYEFLKNEDASLLNFSESDEEENNESDELSSDFNNEEDEDISVKKRKADELEELDDIPSSSEDEEDGICHNLPKKLEVASDSDDDDDDEDDTDMKTSNKKKQVKGGTLVTLAHIKTWTRQLQDKPSTALLKDVISAFKAAVQRAGSEGEVIKYRVEGSTVFNAIIRMCLSNMTTCLYKVMGLPALTDLQKPTLPTKQNKKWRELRVDAKMYLTDLLQLLGELSEPSMLNIILKHIHRLVAFFACFPKLSKTMMKRMISLWSSAEEATRVLAFLCINRLVMVSQNILLEPCMKQMYMAYVKNTKFTSPTTLPLINFMQHSMVEIFSMDYIMTYQFAFVYIRQLAIHLRNAIITKKKETCQAVYNWQYVHCLELWVKLLGASYPNEVLEPLIYPLTQTVIGTIKLQPTPRFYPLRFHCVRILNTLSSSTRTFIPVLPFLLEILEVTDFNKKHKSVNLKPFNFACILKLSKSQLQEKAFKDGLIDQICELLIDHFHVHAHTIGFPELCLPALLQLKDFLKKCKVANYCKQVKQIVDKVEETSRFITNRRKSASVSLSDLKAIESWERLCQESGTPLGKYYKTWRKQRDVELQHGIAQIDQVVGKDDIPMIKRPKGPLKATAEEKDEFTDLFKDDSDESDDETRFLPKSERPAKKQKTSPMDVDDDDSDSQEYSDFDSDELEILARSGDEDSAEEDDEEENVEDDDEEEHDEDVEDTNDVIEDFQLSDSD